MELFRLRDERASTMSYAYHISMLEVYNETVVDLLDDSCGLPEEEGGAKRAGLDVRMGKGGVFVAGLVEVEAVFARGRAERKRLERHTGQVRAAKRAVDGRQRVHHFFRVRST